jgi:hypothetical protein
MEGELAAAFAGRAGWRADGAVARYGPTAAGWQAAIRHTLELPRMSDRWHVAVCDRSGVARHALMGRTALEAVTFAESLIAAQPSD